MTPTPQEPGTAPDMRAICEALGFDPTNHHNAAKCPYCRPAGPTSEPVALTDEDIETAIDEANRAFNKHQSNGPRGQTVTVQDDWKHWLARAVESKVRAALAAAPLPSETPCK